MECWKMVSMLISHWQDPFHYVKTWHHSQNQRYITYCTVIRAGLGHGHRSHVQKILWCLDMQFLRLWLNIHRRTDCNSWRHYKGQSRYHERISIKKAKVQSTVIKQTIKLEWKSYGWWPRIRVTSVTSCSSSHNGLYIISIYSKHKGSTTIPDSILYIWCFFYMLFGWSCGLEVNKEQQWTLQVISAALQFFQGKPGSLNFRWIF